MAGRLSEVPRAVEDRVHEAGAIGSQHGGGPLAQLVGSDGGSGEVGVTGLADDPVFPHAEAEPAKGEISRRRSGGGHGVGGVIEAFGREHAVDEAKEGGSDVQAVRDQTDSQAGRIQDAPHDIVVAIELLGTSVGQVGEAGGARRDGFAKPGGRGVGVAQADADPQADGGFDGGEGSGAFGCQSHQDGGSARRVAQFVEVFRAWIPHVSRVMGPMKSGLVAEKRTFQVPAGDEFLELGFGIAEGAESAQSSDQPAPVVGDQGEEERAAAVAAPGVTGAEQVGDGQGILLEVDAGVAVDLGIEPVGGGKGHGRGSYGEGGARGQSRGRAGGRRIGPGPGISGTPRKVEDLASDGESADRLAVIEGSEMERSAVNWRRYESLVPWLAAGVAAVLFAWWLKAPVATPVTLREPGADRPAGIAVAGLITNVFAAGKLESGPGKAADLAGSWPRFRGPRLDGIGAEADAVARSWPGGKPAQLWSIEVGEGFAGPVVANGRVYLMDYDRTRQRDAVRCLSLADGAEIWRFSYPVTVKRNHGLTRTVPALAGGGVVAIGPKCHVVVVEADTGRFRWGIDLEKDHGTTVPPWYTGQCPLVDGDLVILAPGGPEALLMGVELESGTIRWRTPNPNGWKMTHSSVVPMELAGRPYYLYCASGGVVAVNAADGSVAWESNAWKINIATVPTPVLVEGGRVFLTGGYNAGCLMLEFTGKDGKLEAREVFRARADVFGATQHSPIWYRGHLYGIRADGRFVCLSPEGKVVWASGPEASFGLGPLLMAGGGLIFALNERGRLVLLEAVPEAYRPLAQAEVMDGHECWAPMALAGGRLLVRDLTRMVCLQVGP